MKPNRRIGILLVFTSITTFLTSSCSVQPEVLSSLEKRNQVYNSLDALEYKDQNVISIDLRQAIVLAIENNLEYRLNKMQAALAYKQYDLAKLDLYPKIDVNTAYDHRNKDYIKNLINTSTGTGQSLIPHTIKTGTILFNWNVLDFGLSYIKAKQASDRYLAVTEQRKKIAMKVINDVVKNYALAYYAQEINKQIREVEQSISDSLKLTDTAIDKEIGERDKLLANRKILLDLYKVTREHLVYFNQSRDKLLNLINFNSTNQLGANMVVLMPLDKYLSKLPVVNSNLASLDVVALFNRPEITEASYKTNEVKRQKIAVVLEKLPSLGFSMGYNYDSDKFLKFQNWWSDNVHLAWNLLQLAAIEPAIDTVETQIKAQELTYLASSAVVLGEIRVLLYNYKMRQYDYNLAEKESAYTTAIYKHNLNLLSTGMNSEQEVIKDKIASMNSELEKIKSFVDARNLLEDVIMSLGLYQLNGELVNNDHVNLAVVDEWLNMFNTSRFDDIIKKEYEQIQSS